MSTKQKNTTKKEKPKASNMWVCPNCEGEPCFEHKEMMDHLKSVHGVTDMKGNRRMNMHTDASDWFMSQYEWTIDGKTYHQTVKTPRSKDDMMYWA